MKEIDFKVSLEDTENDIKKLYKFIRSDVNDNDIEYYQFNEGVLNLVVKLDDAKHREPLVFRSNALKILKLRNEGEERTLDPREIRRRVIELASMKKANDLNITVKLVASYKNGFVYKYVDADLNNLDLYDLQMARKVATKMARLHSIDFRKIADEEPAIFSMVNYRDEKREAKIDKQMKDSSAKEVKQLPLFSQIKKEFRKIHTLILENDAYGEIGLWYVS